jgi:hypothetical protein
MPFFEINQNPQKSTLKRPLMEISVVVLAIDPFLTPHSLSVCQLAVV